MANQKQWQYATPFFRVNSYNDRIFITASLDKACLPDCVPQEMVENIEEVLSLLDCVLKHGIAGARNQQEFDKRMQDILNMQEEDSLPQELSHLENVENFCIEMPNGRKQVMGFACSEEKKQHTLAQLQALGAKITRLEG